MKVYQDRIGETSFTIQVLDDEPQIVGAGTPGRQTKTTGMNDALAGAWRQVVETTKQMAADIGDQFETLAANNQPKSVELEFRVGMSAKFGAVWFLASAETNSGLTVKLKWERSDAE